MILCKGTLCPAFKCIIKETQIDKSFFFLIFSYIVYMQYMYMKSDFADMQSFLTFVARHPFTQSYSFSFNSLRDLPCPFLFFI